MTAKEIVAQLKALGQESIKNTLLKHGICEPVYGVKVEELKKIQKTIKKDHTLSLALFETGIYDAMYLAGLIADETNISKNQLMNWATHARSQTISEYTVPGIAAESSYGMELALEWIDSPSESIASSGWSTLSSLLSIRNNSDIDTDLIQSLLQRVAATIHSAANRVKYTMNGFVIAAGIYIPELTAAAKAAGATIGKVSVSMGATACKVPVSHQYISKAADKGIIGKKRSSARC